jgi:hypothetical protein
LSPLFQKALERAKALFIARYFKAFALTIIFALGKIKR